MAPIPGWAYILVGAMVSGTSWFVENKSGQNMKFFLFAGILFFIIGVGKIIMGLMMNKKARAPSNPPAGQPNQYQQGRQGYPAHQMRWRASQQGYANQQVGNQQMQQRASPMQPRQPYQAGHHSYHTHVDGMDGGAGHQGQHQRHIQPVRQDNTPSAAQHPSVISCPACGIKHYNYANFCMICGTRIRY